MNKNGPHKSAEKASTRKAGAPSWAMQPFKDLVEESERIHDLLRLSMQGISVLRAMPGMVTAIANAEGTSEDASTAAELTNVQRTAELAQREVDEGFPILHAHGALALWALLEATVRLFVARWLENQPGALDVEIVQKLKVRIGEYERLTGEDRVFYIVDRIEQEVAAVLRSGVNRFESILEPFSLSGPLDANLQRDLFELSQIRNALMHRAGKADSRLIEACPWLGLRIGQKVVVDTASFKRYEHAVMDYAICLIARVGTHFGVDMKEYGS